ncbi:uncharacterized protein NPIL_219581 [Nephila pilipes]|uniref:Uncharacterized protein n=1 Tax=Nephila pilipes TaxID=299642 RepID=A0A8X6NPQ6_NEPPI|nr:uncharacterized protein NPIL_87761 [Nephila pilipes]GFT20772.1 uncharacterized protein NPIL_508301 [Nephila pilipes]GFT25160.1 uncharacterized protein NPIL_51241 [Nephila pilipes]GFT94759.1 uncharacterized protein NPIL_219581 [Nephila pilipes]
MKRGFFEEEEEDYQILPTKKTATKKGKPASTAFDLDLSPPCSVSDEKKIPPYSIYLGKGVVIELKEFRKSYYIAFSKSADGEVKNRFNLALDQLHVLLKAVEALVEYLKEYN